MPKYFAQGLNGLWYAVFDDTDDAWDYCYKYGGRIACFSGYENAVCVNDSLGMDGIDEEAV